MVDRNSILRDLLLLTLVFGGLFFSFLGNRPLAAPDEGRYVEIPREMAETGDYVTPRLNGLKYFEKPPLMYWLQTLPIKAFGIKEWAMRLPLAILALLGCLMTYLFTRRLWGRTEGFWSATFLGSSLLYTVLGRLITLDLGVSFFLTGMLFSFICAVEDLKNRRWWMWASAAMAAGAVLTKGLIGLVIPGAIVFFWLLLTNRWSLLKELYLPSNIGLFVLLAAPWHILASLKNPGFFDFYFIHEHFERYLTTVHRRHQPLWFFLPIILLGFFPWTSFLFRGLKNAFPKSLKACRENSKTLFFLLWALVPFVFFSLSNSKLIPYILPIFPALAVLCALKIPEHLSNIRGLRGEIFGYSAFCFLIVLGITFGLLKAEPELKVILRTHLMILYTVLGASAVLLPVLRLLKGPRPALWGTLISGLTVLMVFIQAAPLVPRLTIKPLADRFLAIMPQGTKVFTYITYYQDLPPYLNRTVQVVNWYGELKFGSEAEPNQQQIITTSDFKEAWIQAPWACVFVRQDKYNDLIQHPWFTPTLLGEHDGQLLACNHVPEDALLQASSPSPF